MPGLIGAHVNIFAEVGITAAKLSERTEVTLPCCVLKAPDISHFHNKTPAFPAKNAKKQYHGFRQLAVKTGRETTSPIFC
jgi:hypothetical protein